MEKPPAPFKSWHAVYHGIAARRPELLVNNDIVIVLEDNSRSRTYTIAEVKCNAYDELIQNAPDMKEVMVFLSHMHGRNPETDKVIRFFSGVALGEKCKW